MMREKLFYMVIKAFRVLLPEPSPAGCASGPTYNEKKPAQVRAFIFKRAILPLNKTVDRYLGHLSAQFIIYFY